MILSLTRTLAVVACLTTSVALAQSTEQSKEPGGETTDSVSFTKHVAPIIVGKCGNCHVANSRGRYGIASYDALMSSKSVVPGDPASSNFLAVIESGEMPKNGPKVSDSELATLKKWIAQGAKYDGETSSKALMPAASASSSQGRSQRGGRNSGGSRLHAVEKNPQAVGAEGVAWYTTWETGLEEAKRSNRPIFFMSVAAQCTGVPGVF